MSPSVIAALVAVVISSGSLIVAVLALRTARTAHALNARRDREERQRRDAEQFEQARRVTLDFSYMGAPAAHILNGADDSIADAQIDSVQCVSRLDLTVEPNRNVRGWRSAWATITPGEKKTYPVILVDSEGIRDDLAGLNGANTWRVECSFTDAKGQRWRRTGSSDPERVER